MRRYVDPIPEYNATRNRKVFAWLPVRIENMEVWLEHYFIVEAYIHEETKDSWVAVRKALGDEIL